MILIAGPVFVQEGKMEIALEAVAKMVAASQQEDGCVHYNFYIDRDKSDQLFIFEEWETQEALDAHGKTEHMAAFRAVAGDFLTGPRALQRYMADSKEPL